MRFILCVFTCLFSIFSLAQSSEKVEDMVINGQLVQVMQIDGDTIIVADLEGFNVSAVRGLDATELRRYRKYRRYAQKVYPYAIQAIRLFRENEQAMLEMNNWKRRKYVKRIQDEYEEDFKPKLKKLTRLQGQILVKMIERELERPFYDLLKDLRGGINATYWHTFSRLYGYNLKEMYQPGKDKILDAVLYDYDVSHEYLETSK